MLLGLQQLPALQRLEQRATRLESPCGPGGSIVWHRWGDGPPLVLLHGGSGSWNHWLRNVEALAKRYTVFAADLPGCGDSALPAGARDADTIHSFVADGIAQLGEGAAVELVAFSFGTLVAGYVAATRPELVRRLHLVGCAGLGLTRPALQLRSLSTAREPGDEEAIVRANMESLMVLHPQTLDETALSMHYANLLRDRLRRRRISRTPVMLELQRRWQCPVRAVWGAGDILIRHDAARLREVLAGCDLRALTLIDDAGHWVQYERPEAFDAVLAQGLQDDTQR
jgi:2-hydroxy-6-oxonona-2,4-dienedioate hydrolase